MKRKLIVIIVAVVLMMTTVVGATPNGQPFNEIWEAVNDIWDAIAYLGAHLPALRRAAAHTLSVAMRMKYLQGEASRRMILVSVYWTFGKANQMLVKTGGALPRSILIQFQCNSVFMPCVQSFPIDLD
jgi:hypothetical protein